MVIHRAESIDSISTDVGELYGKKMSCNCLNSMYNVHVAYINNLRSIIIFMYVID